MWGLIVRMKQFSCVICPWTYQKGSSGCGAKWVDLGLFHPLLGDEELVVQSGLVSLEGFAP